MAKVTGEGLMPLGCGAMKDLDRYLAEKSAHFNPDAIYRAKAWGRLEPQAGQADFVDAGLMPLVEQETGGRVSKLLEECVRELADALGWTRLEDSRADDRKAKWLIKAPFWLLAAKILRDKRVRDFIHIDLNDLSTVFSKLAKHYRHDDTPAVSVPVGRRRALGAVAERIGRFASLELLSAEALGGTGDAMDLFTRAKGKSRRVAPPSPDQRRILHLRVDAEVMKLYALPPAIERKVLDLFTGEPRKGVPFAQTGYYPDNFDGLLTVSDLRRPDDLL